MFAIHYHKETGKLRAWGVDDGSTESFAGPEYAIARFDEWQAVDHRRQKIDVDSLALVDRSQDEIDEDRRFDEANARAAENAFKQYLRDLLRD